MSASTFLAPPSEAGASGRWGVALREGREPAGAALRELSASYWYCVYAWWRREGSEEAGALTQACFTRWLTTDPPHPEQPGAACFREWLRARLAEGEVAAEGEPVLEIAVEWAESRYAQEPAGSADEVFQRRWALTVLEFAMEALRVEYAARGQETLLAELQPLAGFAEAGEEHYDGMAARLEITVGAAHRAAYEFRTRYRAVLRALVADTVAAEEDLDSEITTLLCACAIPEPESEPAAPLPVVLRTLKPDELFARALQTVRMTSGGQGLWTPPSMSEMTRLFPQYEMLGLLGRGGMGAVYQARQIELDRCVAIKLLPLEVSVDQDFAGRFVREARAMAKLSHPHIVTVYDFGHTSEGHLYFVMEYVEGSNLSTLIHGAGVALAPALQIVGQVCAALAYAHGKGVVHRDIKPANVMVTPEGEVKVADFGLARMVEPGGEQTTGLTVSGTVMGTPDYMAPEQSRGMDIDHRADLYSVGVMLYEMLCREIPRGVFDLPSHRIGCDPRVDAIIVRAMQQAPERRHQDAQEMGLAVTAALAPAPAATQAVQVRPVVAGRALVVARPAALVVRAPRRPPTRWALFMAVAIILVGAVFAWIYRAKSKATPTPPAETTVSTPAQAEVAHPFLNSLQMKFVPVPISGGPTNGQRVLFSVWETRVSDYSAFASETAREWPRASFQQTPAHPAINVSWIDAQEFCTWLTGRERASGRLPQNLFYRLPTDHEWSCVVGLSDREKAEVPARRKRNSTPEVYPWGTEWPPPPGIANLPDEAARTGRHLEKYLAGYNDGFAWTAPVGSFRVHSSGLYDLSGNVWEWCEDWYDDDQTRVLRGGSHDYFGRDTLWSCYRGMNTPASRTQVYGFRVVLSERAAPPFAPPTPVPKVEPVTAEFRGHRYLYVVARGVTWPVAKQRAEEMGGHLATITDAAEQEFLAAYCQPLLTGGNNMAWLGGERISTEPNGFRWITGEPFAYTAWGGINPSSRIIGDQLTLMRYGSGGEILWNDFESKNTRENIDFYLRGFLVEWETLK